MIGGLGDEDSLFVMAQKYDIYDAVKKHSLGSFLSKSTKSVSANTPLLLNHDKVLRLKITHTEGFAMI